MVRDRTIVTVRPAPVVSLAEAKRHLRIDHSDDDIMLSGLIAAATAALDGPDGWLGRALGLQTIEFHTAHFPGFHHVHCGAASPLYAGEGWGVPRWHPSAFQLPCPPIVEVDEVRYLDPTGVWQIVDSTTYTLEDRALFPDYGLCWPMSLIQPGAVVVTYQAGYDPVIPPPVKVALLMMIGELYANRNDAHAQGITKTTDALLSPMRVFA